MFGFTTVDRTLEALAQLGIRGDMIRKELDRDGAIKTRIRGAIHPTMRPEPRGRPYPYGPKRDLGASGMRSGPTISVPVCRPGYRQASPAHERRL
jgi:hypothetical protein